VTPPMTATQDAHPAVARAAPAARPEFGLVAVGRRRSAHRAGPAETDESTETTGRR
jgi:hypothetical protein